MIKFNQYIILGFLVLFVCSCYEEHQETLDSISFETLETFDTLSANVDQDFVINSETDFDYLILNSALTNMRFDANDGHCIVPADSIKHKGRYRILLFKGTERVGDKEVFYEAGKATGLIENYIGPKTIWPNGIQDAMLFSVAKDKFENPITEGEEIVLLSKFPSSEIRRKSPVIKNLHTSLRFTGDRKASKIYTGSSKEKASGHELETEVVPYWPINVKLSILSVYPYSDHRQRFKIHTDQLLDQFGNVLVDGTKVDFIIENKNGYVGQHHSFTIDGKASISIQNPGFPDQWKIYGSVGNRVKSKALDLQFTSNIRSFDVAVVEEGNKIKIGPIVAALNQMTTDGTEVVARISNKQQTTEEILETENGFAFLDLTLLSNGTYQIEIAISDKTKSFKIVKD